MKKAGIFAFLLALLWTLALPVFAVPRADTIISDTEFAADGSCRVSVSMTVQLEQEEYLNIPLPAGAKDIALSSSQRYSLVTEAEQLLLCVELSGSGSHKIAFSYLLDNLLTEEKGNSLLTLPILSGLHYPVSYMEFSVTFPRTLTSQPVLESGYYQQNVGQLLEYSVDGATVSGHSKMPLKDRETLVMTLQVPEDMFRNASWQFPVPDVWDLVMFLLVILAAVYFLLTLMPKLPGRNRCFTTPEGITAGDVGTCLTGCGTDLTMLVLSWARLGYILIEMDHKNRVTLHKRMEMGNERNGYEVRWFKSLFGQRTMVDADSYHYAKLCRKLAAKSPLRSQLYDKKSGNPTIFRGICMVVGIVAGLHMGLSISVGSGAKILLAMIFALLCGVFSYFIQSGGKCLPLRDKTPLWTALGCGAAWIALGLLANRAHQVMPVVIFQFVAGIGAAYGGKRSDMGWRYMSQIRGLRRHMVGTSSFDLQQLLQKNPNYFYELAPYALALGVDRGFARRFGKQPLPEDSYLLCGAAREMTAAKFAARLRKAADVLNHRQKRLPYEQFRGK